MTGNKSKSKSFECLEALTERDLAAAESLPVIVHPAASGVTPQQPARTKNIEHSDRIETLTERDVAAALHCSPAGLRRMRREGRGPRWFFCGRLIRYTKNWLLEYINQNEAGRQQ